MSKLTDKTKKEAEKLNIAVNLYESVSYAIDTNNMSNFQQLINFLDENRNKPNATISVDSDFNQQEVIICYISERSEEEVLSEITEHYQEIELEKKQKEEKIKNRIKTLEEQIKNLKTELRK